MIYIVEIDDQKEPCCWSVKFEGEAIHKLYRIHNWDSNMPKLEDPFREWLLYNSHDLHSQYVFMDAQSAINGLKEISGRGTSKAIAALREELKANGELPEELDHGR
jgi:hypothetical protein